jgi:tricarballylate dehydrogenase
LPDVRDILIVGHGAAGLTAALAAAEVARDAGRAARISVIERAPEGSHGGNTRWSPAYMRLAAPDRLDPRFEDEMLAHPAHDRSYFSRLAANATSTVAWLQHHGLAFDCPPYYLSAGPRRIQPVGGGAAIVRELTRAARQAGVTFLYHCRAERLIVGRRGAVSAVDVRTDGGSLRSIAAHAVILACGGFQGDAAMLGRHFGPGGESLRLISPGTVFNSGDGIRMALGAGARTSGDWQGMHAEPVDPRSNGSAPVVLVYPYGIVVDRAGRRFFDEGCGLVHESWESLARMIHFATPGRMAFAILDSRLVDIAGYERAIRSDVPPVRAESITELAALTGIDAPGLKETIESYNAVATGDPARFDATRLDGLRTEPALEPAKSNWARALAQPPFLAYPLVGAIAYTFGGVATNDNAEVLGADGPIPGLYAAGEITGHFHGTAPNAVSVLRALVFGRIAGRAATADAR